MTVWTVQRHIDYEGFDIIAICTKIGDWIISHAKYEEIEVKKGWNREVNRI